MSVSSHFPEKRDEEAIIRRRYKCDCKSESDPLKKEARQSALKSALSEACPPRTLAGLLIYIVLRYV
jgi:hypothetical protein